MKYVFFRLLLVLENEFLLIRRSDSTYNLQENIFPLVDRIIGVLLMSGCSLHVFLDKVVV